MLRRQSWLWKPPLTANGGQAFSSTTFVRGSPRGAWSHCACDQVMIAIIDAAADRPRKPGWALSLHRAQELVQRHGGEAGGVVAHRIGDDELPPVQERAAGVHHVRHVTFALRFVRREQRLAANGGDACE